ncbi:EAL domain-containing protein [Pseudokineococcus sp. 1T1Z-3]|uniref:EAL domain-containing protein n=1 Tax=Pseudokineococcus sp. 1T1Z-3 TaxID=3132745 RepID=UPI0030B4B762
MDLPLRPATALAAVSRRARGALGVRRVVPAARWRRRQAVLALVLAVHAALLDGASALVGDVADPVLVAVAAVVMVLLAVAAAPLLAPGLRVPRTVAAAAVGAGLAASALALGAAAAHLPSTLTTAHLLLVVVLVSLHRSPVPVVAVLLTALGGRLTALALVLPAPGAAETAAEVVALAAAGSVALVSWRSEVRAATTSGPLVRSTDRDGLRALLVEHLRERSGEPLALLLVGLVAAEGRDGAGAEADDLLHAVTTRAAGAVRDGDVLVRLPDGHLAVLLPGGSAASARLVGERVRDALVDGVVVAGALLDVDASVGAGGAPDGAGGRRRALSRRTGDVHALATADRLLAQVDAALEVARDTGTGVAVVDPDEREGARLADLAVLRDQLRGALEATVPAVPAGAAGGLALRWAPRFDVRAGRWTSAVARLAWEDDAAPDASGRRRPSPLDLAAGTTLAPEAMTVLLVRALEATVAWRSTGVRVQAAVAVPAEALGRPGLVDLVDAALAEAGADPADLRLLVADADVVADPGSAATAVTRLAALGVAVSVTDVGASRSSVAALGALPTDEVVVDAALVGALATGDTEQTRLVRAVVGLGHGLGLRVVAAGVDQEQTHRAATALGCDAVQGAHVGVETTADGIAALVLGSRGGQLLAPARRPGLPSPRRPDEG